MHAAGKVDFWWASLVFRTTALLIVAAAVAVQRPALRLGRRELAIVARGRARRHDRERPLRGVVRPGRPRQPDLGARVALPVVTVLLAAAVLHERVAPLQRAGIVLTLTGVVLISA